MKNKSPSATWCKRHPAEHAQHSAKWWKLNRGYYDRLPARISEYERRQYELNTYYNNKIGKWQKELDEHNKTTNL